MPDLTVEELRQIINRLHSGRDGTKGRYRPLHDKSLTRRQHFHNLDAANPQLPEAYKGKSTYQTDFLRRTHVRHRARVTEHRPVAHVTPPKRTAKLQEKADQLEAVLNRMYDLIEEREGINIQGALSDGQNIDCFGVLHWIKATDIWPELPKREIRESLPEVEGFEDDRDSDGEKTGKFRETDSALQDRNRRTKASAGVPWHVEVVDPRMCSFIADRSTANGFGIFVIVKASALLEYNEALSRDGKFVSINQQNSDLRVYLERDRPDPELSPGETDIWGKDVEIAEVWTRDKFYELVRNDKTDWKLVKSADHPYEMPPFALAAGNEINDSDPVLRYEPVLEGLFRQKPGFDRVMAMNEILAEAIAMPLWWIETAEGLPQLDDEGKPIVLTRDTLAAHALPAGSKLVKADFEINQGFINLLNLRRQEMEDAAPEVGVAEVTGSTQAWAILLQQQQASLEPKQQVLEQQKAIRTMMRNMALVMSKPADQGGFGQPVPVYAKLKNGQVDTSTVIWVEPEDIETLEVDLLIQPRSSAEVITNTQFGLDMLAQGRITEREWREDFKGDEQPTERIKEVLIERSYLPLEQAVIQQALAEKNAELIVLGPNGTFVGMGGNEVLPEQVLQQNGQTPVPTTSGGNGLGSPGSSPGPLTDLTAPGQLPQPGMG